MSTFENWSQQRIEEHNARVLANKRRKLGLPPVQKPVAEMDAVEREDKLHEDIKDFCKRMGWLCFTGSMAHKTKRTLGEPDFTILMGKGRVLFVEAKAKKGTHSSAQLRVRTHAGQLGHIIHEVRSMRAFKALLTLP